MNRADYQPVYAKSWALIIGIDDYQFAPKLSNARSDATAVSNLLVERFGFLKENIIELFDQEATHVNILHAYLTYANDSVGIDDRILIFFAGHGCTQNGNRGEIGFLVPVDGKANDLSTLIRWDSLSRNAELIPAKHLLIILDACFSGLILSRAVQPGGSRYLKDMLKRYSRQVLTAGKADEAVSDAGGPLPAHSIFTGHLINALEGGAMSDSRVLTANNVMAYVANKVAQDQYSQQSPHYGYFDGDGDFVFQPRLETQQNVEEKTDEDILVEVPMFEKNVTASEKEAFLDQVKEYLAEDRHRIKLDTLATYTVRAALEQHNIEAFSVNAPYNADAIRERLIRYETLTQSMQTLSIAVAYWGEQSHMPVLRKMISRYADHINQSSGNTVWLEMQWYPISLLLYVSSVAAIAAEKYDNLAAVLTAEVINQGSYSKQPCFIPAIEAMSELDGQNVFKQLFEEQYLVPRSEYMYKLIQPVLDDALFLSKSYEYYFDKCEVFMALLYFDNMGGTEESGWGPPGRFAWKLRRGRSNAFSDMVKEAEISREAWGPVLAGLFGGSYDRFSKAATGYAKRMDNFSWM